jgi:hypothetical protein
MRVSRRLGAFAAAGLAGYQFVLRPHYETWGATEAEVNALYPDDGVIPGGRQGATMATTIAAPPAAVWPWLVQMGVDRAGWYSWDRLDNAGHRSAERIHPEWQQIAEGDRLASLPDGSRWFDVAVLEPERTLVLRASMSLPGAKPFDPGGERPCNYSDSTWSFHLRPTSDGGTRLITTSRVRSHPRRLTALVDWLVWNPAHWVMQIKQFRELRRRAEAAASSVVLRKEEVAATG